MSTYSVPGTRTAPAHCALALISRAFAWLALNSFHVERREHSPPEWEINNDRVLPKIHPAEPPENCAVQAPEQRSTLIIHCVYFWLWQPLKCVARLPDSFALKPASCSPVSQPVIQSLTCLLYTSDAADDWLVV